MPINFVGLSSAMLALALAPTLALAAAETALRPPSDWWRGFEYVPAPIGFELRTHIDSQSMTANLYHKDFKPMHERDLPLLKQLHGNTLQQQLSLIHI